LSRRWGIFPKKAKKPFSLTFDKAYSASIDALTPIKRLTEDIQKESGPIAATHDPYISSRLLSGWGGIVEHFLERGTLNANREITGKPLREIIEPVKENLDKWRVYALFKRAIELKVDFQIKAFRSFQGSM